MLTAIVFTITLLPLLVVIGALILKVLIAAQAYSLPNLYDPHEAPIEGDMHWNGIKLPPEASLKEFQ